MGRVQLRRTPEMVARRGAIAARYDEAFRGLPVTPPARAPEGSTHAWHLYSLRLAADAPVPRDRFIELMAEAGVGTSVHFIPLHLQPYWRDAYAPAPGDFPVATAEFARSVSLPIFSAMTDDDVEKVVAATSEILG